MAQDSTPTPNLGDEGYRVPAVERAFAIIRVLAVHGPSSLAEVVANSGLNKSTTFYILRTLLALDVVMHDDDSRTYTLGPALMELGMTASGQVSDVAIAKRQLAGLFEALNVTIVLYRRLNVDEIMMVDKIERSHRVRITIETGVHLPIQAGSFGRAFLAFDEPAIMQEALRNGLHKFTPKSLTNVSVFRRELAQVRKLGWAVDHEGFALGVSTVAAPIFGPDGRIVLVAAAVWFANLLTDDVARRCGEQLRDVCDQIGSILGSEQSRPSIVSAPAAPRARVTSGRRD
jgi:DNA-binding IclR family transcriptional regulator